MQKIGVLLIAVSIIGFTNAQSETPTYSVLAPDCTNFPSFKHVQRCCYKTDGSTSFDNAFDSCLPQYKDQPKPEICATECAFEKTTVGDRAGHVNYTAVYYILLHATSDLLVVDHMMRTIKECEDKVIEMVKEPPYSNEAGPCHPRANLIRRCAAYRGTLKCPVISWRTDTYSDQVLHDVKYCQTQDKDLINIGLRN